MTVDLSMHLHRQTPKAVLVSDDGIEKRAIWLPKSLLRIEPEDYELDAVVTITMSERLAYEKGLL